MHVFGFVKLVFQEWWGRRTTPAASKPGKSVILPRPSRPARQKIVLTNQFEEIDELPVRLEVPVAPPFGQMPKQATVRKTEKGWFIT